MTGFIARRLLLLLPTMLLVFSLAFFLSEAAPGDQAEAIMVIQGIQSDSKRASVEYARNYTHLGLDKPAFYLTIVPDYYPANIHSIVSKEERLLTETLLQHRIPFPEIHDFMEAKRIYLAATAQAFENKTDSSAAQNVMFADTPENVKALLPILKSTSSTSSEAAALARSIEAMLSSRLSFFYPVLHWHGSENRFHHRLSQLFRGDLGISIRDGQAVSTKIRQALSWTAFLAITNILLSFLIAIPSGIYAGYFSHGKWDKTTHFFYLLFYSMPVFWLASLFIIYFTTDQYGMSIFPLPGAWYVSPGQSFLDTLQQYGSQMILPVLCLVANDLALLSRIVRNQASSVKEKYFILTAIASGQSDSTIMKNHILPHVMYPMVTILAGRLPSSLAGALIVEVIFGVPGMGRLLHQSISGADWQVVFGILLLISLVSIIAMLMADLLQIWLNPKLRTTLA